MFDDLLLQLKDMLSRFGIAYVFKRYYSVYRAIVMNTADPQNQGRIQVRCNAVSRTDTLDWAYPIEHLASKSKGTFFPPDQGDHVWVMFEEGDPKLPMYVGGWWIQNAMPPDFVPSNGNPPTVRGIVTTSGHKILFDDTAGGEKITLFHKSGSQLVFDIDQSITATTKGGHTLKLDDSGADIDIKDSNGNEFKMSSTGVNISDLSGNTWVSNASGISSRAVVSTTEKSNANHAIMSPLVAIGSSAGSPAVHGEILVAWITTVLIPWAAAHTHIQIGPTTPSPVPLLPPPPTLISATVTINTD